MQDVFFAGVGGDDQHFEVGAAVPEKLYDLDAVAVGEHEVEQYQLQVGSLFDLLFGLLYGAGLGHDFAAVAFVQGHPHAHAGEYLVFYKQDVDGVHWHLYYRVL